MYHIILKHLFVHASITKTATCFVYFETTFGFWVYSYRHMHTQWVTTLGPYLFHQVCIQCLNCHYCAQVGVHNVAIAVASSSFKDPTKRYRLLRLEETFTLGHRIKLHKVIICMRSVQFFLLSLSSHLLHTPMLSDLTQQQQLEPSQRDVCPTGPQQHTLPDRVRSAPPVLSPKHPLPLLPPLPQTAGRLNRVRRGLMPALRPKTPNLKTPTQPGEVEKLT